MRQVVKITCSCLVWMFAELVGGGEGRARADTSGPGVVVPPVATPPQPQLIPGPRIHPLADVSAIVEATVESIAFAYNDVTGPRTVVHFVGGQSHAGSMPATFDIAQFGGPMPDGSFVKTMELPDYSVGSRYILFLAANDWFYTPVWSNLAFRIEDFAGRKIVLGPQDNAVMAFGVDGVRFGAAQMLEGTFNASRPTTPRVRVANISAAHSDVKSALDVQQFVTASVAATRSLSKGIGRVVPIDPKGSGRTWNVASTTPPSP
jgi:hypothetical protein